MRRKDDRPEKCANGINETKNSAKEREETKNERERVRASEPSLTRPTFGRVCGIVFNREK